MAVALVNHRLKAALWYAERLAWPVFPVHSIHDGICTCGRNTCNSPGKHPRTPNGLKDATTDPQLIEQWWTRFPDANVGVRTGATSQIVVLDIDPRHGGDESIAEIERRYGQIPSAVECLTGGGGRHLYFAHPGTPVRNRTALAGYKGIDVRGDGGYVVAPTSSHVSGGAYTWREGHKPSEIQPPLLPNWLAQLLITDEQPDEGPRKSKSNLPTGAHCSERDDLIRAATRYVAAAQSEAEGARNDAAFNLVGHLAAFVTKETKLQLSEFEIIDLLRLWNLRNRPPLSEEELRQVAHSGMKNGTPRKPHVVSTEQPRTPSARPSAKASKPKVSLAPVAAYRPFPVEIVPGAIGELISQGAAAIGCDAAFVALPIVSAVAAAIGDGRRIRLKHNWTEPAVVWTAIVGESGTQKTPALGLALRALRNVQDTALRDYEAAQAAHERDHLEYEKRLQHWKRDKSEGDPPKKPTPLHPSRYIVSDTTMEALAPILKVNPSLLLARDELSGWTGSFDRYSNGKGSDSANWLSAHAGEPILVDRKTGVPKTIYVPRALISVTGGIQPAILDRVLSTEHRENGFAARLLGACPPRKAKRWTDADVDPALERRVAEVFARLLALRGYEDREGNRQPVILSLSVEAKATWVEFYNAHAQEQVQLVGEEAAAWAKLEGYAARFALIVHCVRTATQDATLRNPDLIDEGSMAAGITLSRWFGYETLRTYALVGESDEARTSRRLIELIERRGGRITVRALQQASRRFRTSAAAERALNDLVRAEFGRWERASTSSVGGRPTREFALTQPTSVYETLDGDAVNGGFVDVDSVDASQGARTERADASADSCFDREDVQQKREVFEV